MNHTSKKLIATLAIAWVLGAGSLPAFDLRAFPTSADTDRIVEEGFEPSKKRLELALAQIPDPAKLKSLGGWLDLWRWTDLLSRDASEENASLAQRHFFREKSTGRIFFLTLDQIPP